jgi:hypothetical protein
MTNGRAENNKTFSCHRHAVRSPITTVKDILGAFAELIKATFSFDLSVRLSVRMEQLGSHWTDFHEI